MSRAMRQLATMTTLCLVSSGCAARYVIRPAQGGYVGRAVAAGIELGATPDAWIAEPRDLTDYLTPIALHIRNNSGRPIAVRFDRMLLVDDRGVRYAAINPFPHRQLPVAPAPPVSAPPEEVPVPMSPLPSEHSRHQERSDDFEPAAHLLGFGPLARRTVGRGQSRRGVHTRGRTRRRHYPGGHHRVHGRRYRVYPHTRIYVGHPYPLWPVWGFPFYPSAAYHAHVHVWAAPYYPVGPPPAVRQLGLPEGVLHSGGEVHGFVYFQPVAEHARRLQLSFIAQTPNGQPVATLGVPFVRLELEHGN